MVRCDWSSDVCSSDLLLRNTRAHHRRRQPSLLPQEAAQSHQKKGPYNLSPRSSLIPLLLQQLHDSPIGGHSGYLKTFHKVKQDFYWQGMKFAIKDHIRCCEVCQRTKSDTSKPAGLLQPLPIPDRPWLDISLDFIEGLPKSHGQDVILVVVDRLTKFSSLSTILLLLQKWLLCLCRVSLSFMACPSLLLVIGRLSLLLLFGRNCFGCKAQNWQ